MVGALCILLAYAGLQTGRVKEQSLTYLHFNFAGGGLLFYASIVTGQIGFIILEGTWVVLTLLGYFRRLKRI